jgi:UDP-2,3-diacylglucosamine hydrolase
LSAYFFSDVHLGLGPKDEERKKEDRLLSFLQSIMADTSHLFIVGDLFDFWFEYKTVIPKGFHRTLAMLDEFRGRNIEIHYLIGNHDCWMGDFFSTEMGIHIHHDPFEIKIQRKRVFLHHGDGLAQNDLGYRIVRPILRNRLNVWMYRWLHPDIGVRIAKGTSRSSRAYTTTKHYGEESGMLKFAKEKIREGCDIVVMGHRHQPNVQTFNGGSYVNLGDWITHNTFGHLKDGVMTLNTWKGKP